jgi:xanthine dehydrogenase accessory factor
VLLVISAARLSPWQCFAAWADYTSPVLDLIDTILTRLAAGEAVALCVLVRARGSTPQASGAAMIVLASGQTLGTLGGGCVEADVRTRALRLLSANGSATLVSFKLDHDFGYDDGLMCGGMMDVSIQRLATQADAAPVVALRDQLRANTTARYTITVPDEHGAAQSFSIPFAPTPTLLIAGGGHVGQAIAALAHTLDFRVTVIDDRADIVSAERFPHATRLAGSIERTLAGQPLDPHTFVVIVTRGHRNDAAALSAVIRSDAAYIGMIGSNRKVRTILEGLLRDGVGRERLYRVHAPVGLEIGAITPGEIAVSVCAELIAARRGQSESLGRTLKIDRAALDRWLDRDRL